jgi:hypothetical protein
VSWDLRIFGAPLDLLPDELVEAVCERGVALRWRPSMVGRRETLDGYLKPLDDDGPRQIRIHVEPPRYLDQLGASYELPPEQQSALRSATASFWLAVNGEHDDDWVRTTAEVVAEIAARTGGVIFDVTADRFYGLDEWRAEHLAGGAR